MKIFCTASKDTYITDKIIDNKLRAEDANVGRAGTLDLFKLWNETLINGSGSQVELSRILVKFDYAKAQELTSSILDLSNFTATLKLFDVNVGHAVPSNFNIAVMPLSQAFDEGIGRDTAGFDDLDSCNFLTASTNGTTPMKWFTSGANAEGSLGDVSIDVFSTANLSDGNGLQTVLSSKNLEAGTEHLFVDVTKIVSAAIAGQVGNHGFRISYSGSEETDLLSRFVKRFASRHVINPLLRPRIEISFDDSVQDNHGNFFFDMSGSLFLNSYERSGFANLVSGSALTPVVGSNSLFLKLKSGSYEFITTASQHVQGTKDISGNNGVTGSYVANFAINSFGSSSVNNVDTLEDFIVKSGSVIFDEYWYSLDGNVGFYTGSVEIKKAIRAASNWITREPHIDITNIDHEYKESDEIRFRLFGRDLANEQNTPVKKPIKLKPIIFEKIYYRVRDIKEDNILIDFGESDNSTRVSTDSNGMFFDLHMDILPKGHTYALEFLIIERGQRHTIVNKSLQFAVN